MFPIYPTRIKNEHSMGYITGRWSSEEIDKVVGLCDKLQMEQATDSSKQDMIRCKIARLSLNEESRWIYERIIQQTQEINEKLFRYDLSAYVEDFQYTVYNSETGDKYGWHVDAMTAGYYARKLSFTLQLTDPKDYEGGDVKLHGSHKVDLLKEKGVISFFPSFTLHKVEPITKGIRKSLVGWASGPEFK